MCHRELVWNSGPGTEIKIGPALSDNGLHVIDFLDLLIRFLDFSCLLVDLPF